MKNEIMPLISIIMPAYNMEAYIEDSIKSVISQDYQNWELFIMDDGSTDYTSVIAKKYVEYDNRIHYFYHTNMGLSKTRNKALRIISSDLVAFLDSDDLWLPNNLSISVNEFFKGGQDLLFASAYLFSDNTELQKLSSLRKLTKDDSTYYGENGLAKLIYYNRLIVNAVLAKKDALLDVGGFGFSDTINITEDYCLWIKLVCKGYTLRGFSIPLSLYRQRPNSMSHIQINHHREILEMLMIESQKYPSILNHMKQIRFHLKKYIKYRMQDNDDDIEALSRFTLYFKCDTFITWLCFRLYKYIPFRIFKYIISHFLKRYKSNMNYL